jgi:hypothetical protein
LKIQIIGTLDECEIAADRIAHIFDVRHVPRPSDRDDDLYQVRLDAQLSEGDRPAASDPPRRPLGPPRRPPRRRGPQAGEER